MSLFARGISSRLTNTFPFGSAVASRESRYCRVVWSMPLPFYAVVCGLIHIFRYLSNILVRDCAVVRNAPPYGYQSVLSTFSTPSRQASWVFFAVACFASLVSLSLKADAAESLNQAGTAQSRKRCLGLFALGAAARLDIKCCDVQGVRPSISSTRTRCRGRFSPPWLRTRRPSLRYRSGLLYVIVDCKIIGDSMISSFVTLPRPLFWTSRHPDLQQGVIHCVSLFLLICFIDPKMGNKLNCPSRTGDGERYCRQYRKRRNSDVRNIDASVACG